MEPTEPAGPPPPSSPPSNRSALLIVFLVVFIDLLGFGIIMPLLPIYGDAFLQELVPGGKNSVIGGIYLGWLMSSFSLMQDRKSTRLNSSHIQKSRMPSSA